MLWCGWALTALASWVKWSFAAEWWLEGESQECCLQEGGSDGWHRWPVDSIPHSFFQDQENHALRLFVLCALYNVFGFNIFIYLAEAGLGCGMRDQHVGSLVTACKSFRRSTQTLSGGMYDLVPGKDWTQAPCVGNAVLATGPPGKSSVLVTSMSHSPPFHQNSALNDKQTMAYNNH